MDADSDPFMLRICWVAAAALVVFFALALGSFDSADAPSHVVAVHNQPAANLCGGAGAVVAYWSYYVLGIGSWVILLSIAGYLAVLSRGRAVSHALVRLIGVLLMAISVSSFHGLLASHTGPLIGARAGLLAGLIVSQFTIHFSGVGTFLILLACFAIGAVVALDQFVLKLGHLFTATFTHARAIRLPKISAPRLNRPQLATALGPAVSRRKAKLDIPIDPDAGGLGGTESFDPDALGEEEEFSEELEYEYVDEEGNPIDPDDDAYELIDEEEEEEEEYDEEEDALAPLSEEDLRSKIAKLPLRLGSQNKSIARDEDIPREDNFAGYVFPTVDLLKDPETNFSQSIEVLVREQAGQLEESLHIYGIDGEVTAIESGPAVTLYSVQLAPGTKVAKIQAIATDLARSLSAQNIRIVPTQAGKTTVGIEVPNPRKEKVRLKELMTEGHAKKMILPMFLGKDAAGEPLVADLTKMPHMLIAGTTGSGKSVCINSILISWLYTKRPDELKLVLVDPKMVELSQFAEIPHLMCPVVTEMARATAILEWAVTKMEERYELLREAGVRDIVSYNALDAEELYDRFDVEDELERAKIPKKLPYIVFVVDELADLIMTNKEVEQHIVRVAQKARAVGIHLILATQRPQATVVTGLIKSNMPCRISFKVSSGMDSRIVLDQKGAELLLGAGDMLMVTPTSTDIKRAQGTLVEDIEIRKVVRFLKSVASPNFERSLMKFRGNGQPADAEGIDLKERDPLFGQAVEIMIESGRGSVSLLQRRMSVGYARSSRLIEQMYRAGIIGDHKGSVAREVLITLEDWERMKEIESQNEESGIRYTDSQDDEACGNVPDIETLSEETTVPAEYRGEYRS